MEIVPLCKKSNTQKTVFKSFLAYYLGLAQPSGKDFMDKIRQSLSD